MTQIYLPRALIALLLIQLYGCASVQGPEKDKVVIEGPVYYTVEQDDQLGDIAYAITGSADNWVKIAEHNNVQDARKIRAGDVLEIPLFLIREGGNEATNSRTALQSTSNNSDTSVESDINVVLNPVNINREFELSEMEIDVNRDADALSLNAKIRIVGTYFPKGIYEEPTESAKLITRVAPGTIFDLDAELDGWFRIRLANDVAYIRTIDGKIFFPDNEEILRSAEAK